jgi:alkylation response protein AidB-like acyl-CoA dehydrogenase
MPLTDLDVNVTETERAVRDTAHRFAADVMRPAGTTLDKLTPEGVIDRDSVLWDVLRQYRSLGLADSEDAAGDLSPLEQARLRYIVSEELGWGDAGLAIVFGVAGFPRLMAAVSGNRELMDMVAGHLTGCWAITEPDRSSDGVDISGHARAPDKDLNDQCCGPARGMTS